METEYEYVVHDFGRLLGQSWLHRIEAKLWNFSESLHQWLHDQASHPPQTWRERLDTFLAEQEAAGFIVTPEGRAELEAYLEGWAGELSDPRPKPPEATQHRIELVAYKPSAPTTEVATEHDDPPLLALEIAKQWYLNSLEIAALQRAIDQLPARIADLRSRIGSGGHYAYMIPKNIASLEQELLKLRELLALLKNQQPNLEKAYLELGFGTIEYGGFTPGEIPVGGVGIARVGEAAARVGTVRGLESDPIIFDIALGLPGAIKLAKAGIAGLARAGRSATAATVPRSLGKEIFIDSSKYPQAFQHLKDAKALNHPLTVNRADAAANRAAALRGRPKVPGMDLDEVPPAVLRQPGDPVSVRPILPGDNRGAGASMGNQMRDVPNGGQVIIRPRPGGQ